MKHSIGDVFNELTLVEVVGRKTYPSGQKAAIWKMLCSCGVFCISPNRQVTSGIKQSCGHLKLAPRVKTHGGSRGKGGTPEWRGWRAMRTRCNNPNDIFYARYGGRGIKVCDRWQSSFENFLEDMGKKPTIKHTLDRIDNSGDYEPSNCRWATQAEQANNKRNNRTVTYGGKTMTVAEWAKELGCGYMELYDRVRPRRKLSAEEAFAPFI